MANVDGDREARWLAEPRLRDRRRPDDARRIARRPARRKRRSAKTSGRSSKRQGDQQLIAQNDWSTRQVAKELSIAQPQVVRALALLNLPGDVQDRVEEGALPPATAYEIGKLDDADAQRDLAAQVVAEKLTRSEAVEAVRRRQSGRATPHPVEFRVSDAVTVSVKYRKADRLTIVQALRLALKQAQSLEKGEGHEEAA